MAIADCAWGAGSGKRRIASADSHSVRMWDPASMETFTTIEPAHPINDFLLWPESGLLMAACDAPRIEVCHSCMPSAHQAARSAAPQMLTSQKLEQCRCACAGACRAASCMLARDKHQGAHTAWLQAYFVPALGPAPKWSSFLENLTEELEETAAPTLYEDYR